MNRNYREEMPKPKDESSKIDIGKRQPEAKDVKPMKEQLPKYGNHCPD
jgi:hypothetical protein